jgi:hypothetical protein
MTSSRVLVAVLAATLLVARGAVAQQGPVPAPLDHFACYEGSVRRPRRTDSARSSVWRLRFSAGQWRRKAHTSAVSGYRRRR